MNQNEASPAAPAEPAAIDPHDPHGPHGPSAPGSFGRLFKRAFSADLAPGELLPDEAIAVEHGFHGGSEPLKRVLLWRRGALLAALTFLVPATFLGLLRDVLALGSDGVAGKSAGLSLIASLANVLLCAGVFVALRRWETWTRSRRLALWAWLVAFAAPFALALVPLALFSGAKIESVADGLSGGLVVVLMLAPKALSLVPGVMRAALTAKAVFPGATTPGWVVAIGAPVQMLLAFVVLAVPYQFAGGGLMALALICFVGAPVFLVVAGRRLKTPLGADDALATIHGARVATGLVTGGGMLFLFIALIDIVATLKLSPLDAVVPIFAAIANAFVVQLVAADALFGFMARAATPPDEAHATAQAEHVAAIGAFGAARAVAQPDDR